MRHGLDSNSRGSVMNQIVGYVRDCYSDQHTRVNIENDEVIARALQQKVSRFSLKESIGSKSNVSVPDEDWIAARNFAHNRKEEDRDTVTSSKLQRLMESSEHHKFVREQVVTQLGSHKELYEGYVPMDYDEYVKKMTKCGEWGDHVTLQAAADLYGVQIFIITSFKDACYIEILPQLRYKSNKIFLLSFQAELHYNSIYPQGQGWIY
ncbi:hypothetical protein CQW23_24486 [Capsicum baccatum]|uniref:OTU domain-containing protein n=1 Tax=Capsicum baccatum TaxID=33114 RepID=A0A2G2VUY9_CAPBA|nr:hypothetical protein CQW23_24486 [Capsicum baccatum]